MNQKQSNLFRNLLMILEAVLYIVLIVHSSNKLQEHHNNKNKNEGDVMIRKCSSFILQFIYQLTF